MDENSSDQADLEQDVLQHVRASGYQPVKPRVIAKNLGVPREVIPDVKKAIKRLVKRGQLSYGDKHLVRPADPQSSTQGKPAVTGVFRRTSAGFGFVRPKNAPPGDRSRDVYIPARRTQDASDGDLVVVKLRGRRHRRGVEVWHGVIVEVLERETHRFVGVYEERDGDGYVGVDAGVFAQPIFVGDPGAKSVQPGDKVVIEMVRFPSHTHGGEGVVVEVLGPRGDPGVDTLSIVREFDLPDAFAEEVLETARQQAAQFDETLLEGRLDLTGLTTVTIDPVDARDFDDAISLERLDNGHWRLGVHIADVSCFVPAKSALDHEARDRANSIYLPDHVIPMLPEIISNNLASLQPQRVRYTKSAFLEMTPEGICVDTEVVNGAIKSDRRFTYEEVDEFLEKPTRRKKILSPEVSQLLDWMYELAMVLRRRRFDRGALELTMPELKIDLDKQGRVEGAHLVENTASHQIIEEFMLAANEAVASWLDEQELYFLRRIHEQPDPRKLHALSDFVRELGIPCESLESRFEIKRIVAQVEGRPEQHAVNYAVLRSLQKARYGPEEEGHYALHSDNYCHFTSPIRRYPDLTIHRMLDSLIHGVRPPDDFDQQVLLGEHCSQREQRADAAERELNKVKLLNFLSTRVGQQMEAVITGVQRYGVFAQGTELPADGLIHIQWMADDHYDYDDRSHTLVGRRTGNTYRLGDLVQVEIAHVDVDRRELDFRLIQRQDKSKKVRHSQPRTKTAASKKKRGKKAKQRKER